MKKIKNTGKTADYIALGATFHTYLNMLIVNKRNILYNITKIIIMVIILFIILVIFSQDAYAESFVQDMDNGVIDRTPLLQPGQTIGNLPHGLYQVTGGYVNIGYLGKGKVTKVIGILVNDYPTNLER